MTIPPRSSTVAPKPQRSKHDLVVIAQRAASVGDLEEAAYAFGKAIEADRRNADLHFQLAMVEEGLEEIDASQKPFDPNWHEALSERASADVPEGHVAQQLRKGYKLRDRLIRPAGVVVAKRPAA